MICNRRHILTVSGLSLGSFLLGSSLTFGGTEAELSLLIRTIIGEHYPKATEHKAVVDQFIQDLLGQNIDSLEPGNFLRQQAGKLDKSDLERYILVQFMTSPGFIAVQDK